MLGVDDIAASRPRGSDGSQADTEVDALRIPVEAVDAGWR